MKKSLLLLVPALFLIASCGDKKEENPEPPTHEHIFTDELKFDANSHFFACDCGERINVEDHVDLNEDHLCDVCGFKIPIPPCPEGQHVNANEDEDMLCDICGYPIEYKHAKSVKGEPNAPFILKVDEEKEIKAVLDPTPQRAVEKTFTWKSSNETIATVEVDPTNTAKAKIKGLKPGKVKFTATNDYSPDILFHEFEATVVQFDEENMNLWEYKSDDKSQFGYTSDLKQGVASGTAVLNGLSWEFTRSEAISLNLSKGGMLGFGKGEDPETLVKLVNHNIRKVKSISIETCSANGLANLTVKVGDVTVIEGSTPASNKDYIPPMNSGNLDNLSGDISIQFDTPAMDPSRVEDETYKKPGSVYLKSIWITYEPFEYKTVETIDFVNLYNNKDENHLFDNLGTSSGKPLTIDSEAFSIKFSKARLPGSSGLQDHVLATENISIDIKKTDEVIKYIEFNYVKSSTNIFSVYTSMVDGKLYDEKVAEGSENVLAKIENDHVNSVLLSSSATNYVGLLSITIKTVSGTHLDVNEVKLVEEARPEKTKYFAGEKFDPTGLGNAVISFTDSSVSPIQYSTSNLTFYDGQSYEDPADHSGASEILREGTTYVIAVLLDTELRINIDEVELSLITFTKVKDLSEISDDGSYLLTSPSNHAFVLGSTGADIDAGKGCTILPDVDFGDQLQISQSYENDLFKISENEGTFVFATSTNHTYAFNDNYNVSNSMSATYKYWTIAIDSETGVATISMELPNEKTYKMAFKGNIIKPYEVSTSSISLDIAIYKLVS